MFLSHKRASRKGWDGNEDNGEEWANGNLWKGYGTPTAATRTSGARWTERLRLLSVFQLALPLRRPRNAKRPIPPRRRTAVVGSGTVNTDRTGR